MQRTVVLDNGQYAKPRWDLFSLTVTNRFHAMGVPCFPSSQLRVYWGGRQWGFNGFAHNPVQYATSLRCASLFMHGLDDPRARLAEGRRVFAAAPGPKTFQEFDAVGHEAYVSKYPRDWQAAVSGLMRRAEKKHAVAYRP